MDFKDLLARRWRSLKLSHNADFALAEGVTHVVHRNNSRKKAFTLAEVLITLGIIGVVAALTMPALIANYRNQVYATQLEKSVSMFEQGFKKMLADDGVDSLEHTVLFSSIEGDGYGQLLDFTSNDGKIFVDGMKKYFNIIDVNTVYADTYGGGKAANGGVLYFSDGSSISGYFKSTLSYGNYGNDCEQYKTHGVNFCGFIGFFTIDVNGDKKPNIMGKDKFAFDLSDNARLIPVYGKEFSNFYGGYAPYWRTNSSCGVPGEKINISTNSSYAGCAARIIENGWKIDYL